MKVSILDLHCLNAIADDYETVASILEDVRRSSHGNVDATDVTTCMADLVRDGMADAHRFDPTSGSYEPLSINPAQALGPAQMDTLWFRVNDRGRQQLDEHWVAE